MPIFALPDPFQERPGSPAVSWDIWINDFSLYLDWNHSRPGLDKTSGSTLLEHLGEEGRRVLGSLPGPNMVRIPKDPPLRMEWRHEWTGTETYAQIVSVLTAHYRRERRDKILRNLLFVWVAVVLMALLSQGKIKEAAAFAVLSAVFSVAFFVLESDWWYQWCFRVRWEFRSTIQWFGAAMAFLKHGTNVLAGFGTRCLSQFWQKTEEGKRN